MTRRKQDIVLLVRETGGVSEALSDGPGTVRVIGPELAQTNARDLKGDPLSEVYVRLPEQYLSDPKSIVTTLRTRLNRGVQRVRDGSSAGLAG
jgi:hypothetical protein